MIKKGSKVSVHYTLTVEGQVVDTSQGKDPLIYEHGGGQIIPGLEKQIEGLKAGDKKNIKVTPEDAYGPRLPQAVQKVPRTAFKDSSSLKVGGMVSGQVSGKPFQAKIVELTDNEVTLDMNHPLAGKELSFEVEILTVK